VAGTAQVSGLVNPGINVLTKVVVALEMTIAVLAVMLVVVTLIVVL